MGSGPKTSGDGAEPSFGDRLVTRVRPRRRTVAALGRTVGRVSLGAARFGRTVGLSQVGRWRLDQDVDELAVRPPIDYWPWPDTTPPPPEAAPAATFGDAKLAVLYARMRRPTRPVAATAAPPRRGLPMTSTRAVTPRGRPGAIAAGLQATLDASPPQEPAMRRKESPELGRGGTLAARAPATTSGGGALPRDLAALREALVRAGRVPPRPSGGADAHDQAARPDHPDRPGSGEVRRATAPDRGVEPAPVAPPRGPAAWLGHGDRWRWRLPQDPPADGDGPGAESERHRSELGHAWRTVRLAAMATLGGRSLEFERRNRTRAVIARHPAGDFGAPRSGVAGPIVRPTRTHPSHRLEWRRTHRAGIVDHNGPLPRPLWRTDTADRPIRPPTTVVPRRQDAGPASVTDGTEPHATGVAGTLRPATTRMVRPPAVVVPRTPGAAIAGADTGGVAGLVRRSAATRRSRSERPPAVVVPRFDGLTRRRTGDRPVQRPLPRANAGLDRAAEPAGVSPFLEPARSGPAGLLRRSTAAPARSVRPPTVVVSRSNVQTQSLVNEHVALVAGDAAGVLRSLPRTAAMDVTAQPAGSSPSVELAPPGPAGLLQRSTDPARSVRPPTVVVARSTGRTRPSSAGTAALDPVTRPAGGSRLRAATERLEGLLRRSASLGRSARPPAVVVSRSDGQAQSLVGEHVAPIGGTATAGVQPLPRASVALDLAAQPVGMSPLTDPTSGPAGLLRRSTTPERSERPPAIAVSRSDGQARPLLGERPPAAGVQPLPRASVALDLAGPGGLLRRSTTPERSVRPPAVTVSRSNGQTRPPFDGPPTHEPLARRSRRQPTFGTTAGPSGRTAFAEPASLVARTAALHVGAPAGALRRPPAHGHASVRPTVRPPRVVLARHPVMLPIVTVAEHASERRDREAAAGRVAGRVAGSVRRATAAQPLDVTDRRLATVRPPRVVVPRTPSQSDDRITTSERPPVDLSPAGRPTRVVVSRLPRSLRSITDDRGGSVAGPVVVARLPRVARSGRGSSTVAERIAPSSTSGMDRAQMWEVAPIGLQPAPMIVARSVTGAGTDPARPADVFSAELHRHRAERPRPLPVHLRPLATAIVGDRPVNLATGPASRRALAKVGKVAATTGNTIHVDTARPSAEVIAHELTHVAHPSPLPRFFDDDDRSAEERQAERVAAVMRRAPVFRNTPVLQRAPGTNASSTSSASTVSADALAASLTGGGVVQRKQTIGSHRTKPTTAPPSTATQIPTAPPTQASTQASTEAPAAAPRNAPSTDAQFERILELLEDRIVAELERRGGRLRGGF